MNSQAMPQLTDSDRKRVWAHLHDLLPDASDVEQQAFLDCGEPFFLARGETLYREGGPPDG